MRVHVVRGEAAWAAGSTHGTDDADDAVVSLRTTRAALVLAIAAAAGLFGCDPGDKCTVGQTRCGAAGVIQSCVLNTSDSCDRGGDTPDLMFGCSSSQPGVWDDTGSCDPSQSCVNTRDGARCALAPERDPRCAGDGTICSGNAVVDCFDGYLFPGQDCGPYDTCRAPMPDCAYCSDGTGVADPACLKQQSVCSENSLYTCSCGDRTAPTDCTAVNQVCVTAVTSADASTPPAAFCAYTGAPVPECAPNGSGLYCASDGVTADCMYGYPTPPRSVEPCGPDAGM
jgi:hypothetical protein